MTRCDEHRGRNMGAGLFITDLDGTLLNDQRRIAPVDLAALRRMRHEGIVVALATGRSNYSVEMLLDSLGYAGQPEVLPVDYIIFSTGAGLMDYPDGRILRNVSLGPGDVHAICRVLGQGGLDFMVHKAVPDTAHFLYCRRSTDNPDFQRRLDIYKAFATPWSPPALAGFGQATEVLCIVPEQRGHEIAAELSDLLKQFSVIKATSPLDGKSIWIEIFAQAVSKSKAAAWLAAQCGIARGRICVVGNDYNDEDLLGWSENSFVVANSPATLQARFPLVTSNNQGGVAEAAARWLTWK